MSNITQYPAGLLDLLKVRDRGQMPSDLATAIGGVIDFTQFYLLNVREARTEVNNAPVSGVFNSINASSLLTVPNGEVWYVHAFTIAAVVDAGETIEAAPALRLPGNINQQLGDYYRATAATQSLFTSYAPMPFWAPSGAEFGALISALTLAPAMQLVGTASITRVRA